MHGQIGCVNALTSELADFGLKYLGELKPCLDSQHKLTHILLFPSLLLCTGQATTPRCGMVKGRPRAEKQQQRSAQSQKRKEQGDTVSHHSLHHLPFLQGRRLQLAANTITVVPSPKSPLGWQPGMPTPVALPNQADLWPNQGQQLQQRGTQLLQQWSACLIDATQFRQPPTAQLQLGGHAGIKSMCCLSKAALPKGIYRDADGYLQTRLNGQLLSMHRVVCWLHRGPPPAGHPHCVHLCGVPNCLSPLHLHWASAKENAQMRLWHQGGGGRRGLVYWRDGGGPLPRHVQQGRPALQ